MQLLPSDTHTFFARAALEEENAWGKAITKTLVSSGTELQPRFIFIVQAYCQQALRSARVKPDWKHKPGSRPLVEPIQRASWCSGHLAFLLVRDCGVLQQIALSALACDAHGSGKLNSAAVPPSFKSGRGFAWEIDFELLNLDLQGIPVRKWVWIPALSFFCGSLESSKLNCCKDFVQVLLSVCQDLFTGSWTSRLKSALTETLLKNKVPARL